MTDARGYSPRASLGMDLRAGHVHKDLFGRSPAPAASHLPLRNKRKPHSASSHASNPERPNIPERRGPLELPRLRALEARAAAIPISSSAASSASPRSGSSRAHPYPAGEVVEASSFELVSSMATQATHQSDRDESMEVTPIRGAESTPPTPFDPSQKISRSPTPYDTFTFSKVAKISRLEGSVIQNRCMFIGSWAQAASGNIEQQNLEFRQNQTLSCHDAGAFSSKIRQSQG